MSDIKEIVDRIEGYGKSNYEIEGITKSGDTWNLTIKVREESSTTCYDLCRELNGYDKNDYFSILHFCLLQGNEYFVKVKRVKNDSESN